MQRILTNLQKKATNTNEFCKLAGHKVNIQNQLYFCTLAALLHGESKNLKYHLYRKTLNTKGTTKYG